MMKLKDYKFLAILFLSSLIYSQNQVSGYIIDSVENLPLTNVQIINSNGNILTITDKNGYYEYSTSHDSIKLTFLKNGFSRFEKAIYFNTSIVNNTIFLSKTNNLKEVLVTDKRKDLYGTSFLEDISFKNNTLNSGKKSELIVSKDKAGRSSNNARQMYNKTSSLNVFQTDDAGLQLNIGGRGLNPRRTSNFNVRQNGYDISAEPIGYPESYYVPPFECLQNIEVVRGAGALQYGTQFGGLVNFNIQQPHPNKTIDIVSRHTLGSFGLSTNFTSISGTKNKSSYYTFYNFKNGDGFRPNSDFKSKNFYLYFSHKQSDIMSLSFELTYLDYLAQQPGGLTDRMFQENILQSNRERNWFNVNWLLYNLKFSYFLSEATKFSISTFFLDAHRYAVGFRTNRLNQIDSNEERDLIKSDFNNIGVESKILHKYNLFNINNALLLGTKLYSGETVIAQGPGSNESNPNFSFQINDYPFYESQSNYVNPNLNFAFYAENVIYINKKNTISPGLRFEYINTASEGDYRIVNTNLADGVIYDSLIYTNQERERSFFLYGIGFSSKPTKTFEIYSNLSQNFRGVTFADINIINPNFIINPNIKDENGYTFDFGLRGTYKSFILYDISSFYLFYNNRIGFIQKELENFIVKNEKGNVGNAIIIGQEILLNFNLRKRFNMSIFDRFNYFINFSTLNSEYVESNINGIKGKQVEFVPNINLKTGFEISIKKMNINLQYTYLSKQFTDASNSIESDLSGVLGEIPAYNVLDLSLSYDIDKMTFEFGINNLLNNHYFTTRATGYPGPGIIPSPTRNIYLTFEYRL